MTVEERLARLERGNRNWRRLACVLLAALGAVVLTAQAQPKEPKELSVRSMTLVDDEGIAACKLWYPPRGCPELLFFDADQKVRLALGLSDEGWPALAMLNGQGKSQIDLFAHTKGTACLDFTDSSGTERLRLGLEMKIPKNAFSPTPRLLGGLTIHDAKGDVIWQAPR